MRDLGVSDEQIEQMRSAETTTGSGADAADLLDENGSPIGDDDVDAAAERFAAQLEGLDESAVADADRALGTLAAGCGAAVDGATDPCDTVDAATVSALLGGPASGESDQGISNTTFCEWELSNDAKLAVTVGAREDYATTRDDLTEAGRHDHSRRRVGR